MHKKEALNCFEQLRCEGILLVAITCAGVLNVYGHSDLVNEGQSLFANMNTKNGVNPCLECYTCMVDFFGA